MRSIRLTVSCDRGQSPNTSAQVGCDWARVHIACSGPIISSVDIGGQLGLATRMIVAATGWFDIAGVDDLSVLLAGPDFAPSEHIYQEVHHVWARMLTSFLGGLAPASQPFPAPAAPIPPAAVGVPAVISAGSVPGTAPTPPPAPPGASTNILASVMAMLNQGPHTTSTPETAVKTATHSPPADRPLATSPLPVAPSQATLAAAVPGKTNGVTETYAQRVGVAVAPNRSAPDPAQRERRVKIIQEMVRTVQQYVQTYGAAPDFGSDKPAVVAKVHNYIRSVTTRQQASPEVLDAVRAQLAAKMTI